jgi:hypothetical protein
MIVVVDGTGYVGLEYVMVKDEIADSAPCEHSHTVFGICKDCGVRLEVKGTFTKTKY